MVGEGPSCVEAISDQEDVNRTSASHTDLNRYGVVKITRMSTIIDQGSKPASGIPRLSRLPVLQGSIRGSANIDRKSIPTLASPRSCDKQDVPQPKRSTVGPSAQTAPPPFRKGSKALVSEAKVASKVENPIPASSSDKLANSESVSYQGATSFAGGGKPAGVLTDPASSQPETSREKRKPRPSLSDRTIETLLQIPASPSSNRRKSSFFDTDPTSPMGPPLRPALAMSNSRSRPSSPTKRPPLPSITGSFIAKLNVGETTSGRSSIQPARQASGRPAFKTADHASKRTNSARRRIQSQLPAKSASTTRKIPSSQGKPSPTTSPTKRLPTSRQLIATKSSTTSTIHSKTPSVSTPTTESSSSYQSRRSSIRSSQSCYTEVDANMNASSKNSSNSSAALREAIKKAKKELVSGKPSVGCAPGKMTALSDAGPALEETGGLLRKRIREALLSGNLNVAAMELPLIPSEIKHMYDISEESDVVWSECVDLTKFIAADNKLETLEDDVFPDKTNTELEDAEAADYNSLLRGLESLDLHSNLLKELPLGLRRLEKLRSLNLSGNKLGQNAFGIVCQLGDGLTELKMSQNELSGPLPDHIENLSSLQVLNLDGNKISEIPKNLQELVHLKVLNLADNKLSSIPCEILATLPLVELIISGNQLSGELFSSEIQSTTTTLKLLDVSRNKLDALGAPRVVSASVQTVNLSGNRLKIPPDISSWRELLTFAIAENMIAEVPPGLVTLRKLRNADLSNNNITKIDSGIASMENLVSINLAGNPLRERKYLTMAADDLKADLQKRDLDLDASLAPDLEMPHPNSSSGGILDWSSKSLSGSELPLMSLDSPVFDIRLHHNSLDTIPVSLLSAPPISQTLRSLDVSHNPLQTPYLSSPISLPQLKDLSLVSCHLKDLDALTSNLSAPKMTTLNLSANHLSGPLPPLRTHFRSLITLLAANNQFSLLEVASTQGLATLDIRNNEIDHLEPKLGLLGGKAGLKCLEVSGNKFRVPRREVLVKGTEAILRYLKGRVPLEELEDEATRTEVELSE